MSICIVGGGVAGTLVCLELIRKGVEPSRITIIDPFFDGGAVIRDWGAIFSNTSWKQISEPMNEYPTAQPKIQELSKKYEPEFCVQLQDLGWLLNESIRPYFQDLNLIVDTCTKVQEVEEGWEVQTATTKAVYKTIILCQGGRQKPLDFGKPSIPLQIALNPQQLARYIRPNQSVAVFGLAHSGTLICKHLLDLGAKVYGIHKSKQPFFYDRDGEYDGIKQESAEIADKLLQESPQRFEFVIYEDTRKVVKTLGKVHWIIAAIGFEGSPIQIFRKDGSIHPWESYSPETAEVAPSLYGFGLAYPGVTTINNRVYKDVSIPSFLQQIKRCLPNLSL
jgi:hypothetical protein